MEEASRNRARERMGACVWTRTYQASNMEHSLERTINSLSLNQQLYNLWHSFQSSSRHWFYSISDSTLTFAHSVSRLSLPISITRAYLSSRMLPNSHTHSLPLSISVFFRVMLSPLYYVCYHLPNAISYTIRIKTDINKIIPLTD